MRVQRLLPDGAGTARRRGGGATPAGRRGAVRVDADADLFKDRALAIIQDCRSAIDTLVIEARGKGVELSVQEHYSGRTTEAKVAGLQAAIKAAEAEVEADRKRALNTLERARLTAQRKVLMSGVSEEALTILDTIPNARTLMVEAAQQRIQPMGIDA